MFEWFKIIFSGDKSKPREATLEKRDRELKELPVEPRELSDSNTEEKMVSVRKINKEIGKLPEAIRLIKLREFLQLYKKLPELRGLIEKELFPSGGRKSLKNKREDLDVFDAVADRELKHLLEETKYVRAAYDRIDQISGLLAHAKGFLSPPSHLLSRPREKHRKLMKLRDWLDKAERISKSVVGKDLKTHPRVSNN